MRIPTQRWHIGAIIALLFFGDTEPMASMFDQTLALASQTPSTKEVEGAKVQLGNAQEAAKSILTQKEINQSTRSRLDPSLVEQFASYYGLPSSHDPVTSKPATAANPAVFDVPRQNPSMLDAVRQRQLAGRPKNRSYPAFDDESFRQASYEVRGAGNVDPNDVSIFSRPLRSIPRDARGKTDTAAYDTYIEREAKNAGIDPALVKAVIHRESYFNPRARSNAGAQGLMQLMPATAKDMGVADVFDPEQNIRGGTRYLAMLVRRYHGDTTKALAAYNAGMKHVDDHNGVPPFKETREYVEAVNKHYGSYRNKK